VTARRAGSAEAGKSARAQCEGCSRDPRLTLAPKFPENADQNSRSPSEKGYARIASRSEICRTSDKTKSNVLLGRAEHGRPRRGPTPRIVPAVLAQRSWRTVCAHPVQPHLFAERPRSSDSTDFRPGGRVVTAATAGGGMRRLRLALVRPRESG
jgi:hypothetical protein